uniref:Uncharacterized protein n=1 Tax=Ditylum brightwellii TaxID=49249 RepID=A0A6V2EEG0_9STRA|mmetsp:Transcript_28703/g.43032  ORF Transcript_28703/g.43032 Transcript_28703/m.43032 type:complete len:192 (+) Transcript_28703:173-748(+)
MTKPKPTFTHVEIREYPIILGNNPATTYGPSVELGWEYAYPPCQQQQQQQHDNANNKEQSTPEQSCHIKINDYEKQRQTQRKTTASKPYKLYLSPIRRETMLANANYTKKEIQKATRSKDAARRQRSATTFLMNPVIKVQLNVERSRQEKKLKRAKRNLRGGGRLSKVGEVFYDHEDIYKGWRLPFSGDLF